MSAPLSVEGGRVTASVSVQEQLGTTEKSGTPTAASPNQPQEPGLPPSGSVAPILRHAAIVEIDRSYTSIINSIEEMRDRCCAAGEALDLPKDCPCTHHDGPHWLHMDAMWRERNRALLKDATALAATDPFHAAAALRGYFAEEVNRLTVKAAELRSCQSRTLAGPTP